MSEISQPTSEKIQNEFLTCPICYEVYRDPKCLPCLHSLCTECLSSYIKTQEPLGARRNRGYPCPVCKKFTPIRNVHCPLTTWVDEVQNNFIIQNMIDMLVKKEDLIDQSEEPKSGTLPSAPPAPPVTPSAPSATLIPFSHFLPRQANLGNERNVLSVYLPPRSTAGPRIESAFRSMLPSNSTPNVNAVDETPPRRTSVTSLYRTRISEVGPPRFNQYASATYSSIHTHEMYYVMAARNWNDYVPPKISDVIYLPKNNGIALLDWTNRAIKFVKNVFLRRNVTTSMEVVGRPCSLDLLDRDEERVVIITLLQRKKLYLIKVPELDMVDVMDVGKEYRGITALSKHRILVSSEQPPVIDLLLLDNRHKLISTTTVYQRGRWDGALNFDVYKPYYMVRFSPTLFGISDLQRKCIVCFEIDDQGERTTAKKVYTLTPPEYSAIREAGGMCYSGGSLYIADGGNHEVLKITFGRMVKIETVLRRGDGLQKPASVCVTPSGEIVVVSWEGQVSLYRLKET